MTSNINPNTIDASFPIAGQDNDTQGFRNNFEGIRNNFITTRTEITELQDGSVSLDEENDFGFNGVISKAILKNNANSKTTVNIDSGSASIDVSNAIIHELTLTTNTTLSFANWPNQSQGGSSVRVIIGFSSNTSYTLTLPDTIINRNDIPGITSARVITFPTVNATVKYIFDFLTFDGGTSIYVTNVNREINKLIVNGNNITQTTVGSAGSANALPATPTGYVKININGAEYIMPYYDAS